MEVETGMRTKERWSMCLKRQRLSPGSGLQLYQGEGPLCLCGGDGPQEKLGRFQILCLQLLRSHPSPTVYYTHYGNRYHGSLSCSALKRTAQKGSVILSQWVESLLKNVDNFPEKERGRWKMRLSYLVWFLFLAVVSWQDFKSRRFPPGFSS